MAVSALTHVTAAGRAQVAKQADLEQLVRGLLAGLLQVFLQPGTGCSVQGAAADATVERDLGHLVGPHCEEAGCTSHHLVRQVALHACMRSCAYAYQQGLHSGQPTSCLCSSWGSWSARTRFCFSRAPWPGLGGSGAAGCAGGSQRLLPGLKPLHVRRVNQGSPSYMTLYACSCPKPIALSVSQRLCWAAAADPVDGNVLVRLPARRKLAWQAPWAPQKAASAVLQDCQAPALPTCCSASHSTCLARTRASLLVHTLAQPCPGQVHQERLLQLDTAKHWAADSVGCHSPALASRHLSVPHALSDSSLP